jgi:hypothetical protein
MNVHHVVELFYYVVRFGGITRAAQNMPYGIRQPAISGQLRRFEKELGVTLFRREPFQLTESGEELYEFARPFFDGVDTVELRLRTQSSPRLRIAASELVPQHYLPSAIDKFRRRHPDVRFALQRAAKRRSNVRYETDSSTWRSPCATAHHPQRSNASESSSHRSCCWCPRVRRGRCDPKESRSSHQFRSTEPETIRKPSTTRWVARALRRREQRGGSRPTAAVNQNFGYAYYLNSI